MSETVRLAVILAVHNRLEYTQRCVACVRVAAERAGVPAKFVVVDDGSTDGTAEWLQAQADVIRLAGDGNLWFGGATDLALRRVGGLVPEATHLLILNNDVFLDDNGILRWLPYVGPNRVVGGCWRATNDASVVVSVGCTWHRWRGHRETLLHLHERGGVPGPCVPVDALATTLLIAPAGAAKATERVNVVRHPQHRYDVLLTESMRRLGFTLHVLTYPVADHDPRSSSTPSRGRWSILRRAFIDPLFVGYLPGRFDLVWQTAPRRSAAFWVAAREVAAFAKRFVRGRA